MPANGTGGAKIPPTDTQEIPEGPIPCIIIAWDPALVSPDAYARLIALLDEVARSAGAEGIERIASATVTISKTGPQPKE